MENEKDLPVEFKETESAQGALSRAGAFSGDIQSFENAARIAGALSKSTLVPKDYQGNVANCMIALEMSQRVNANPLACMQNLYIIHGRPAWSSQFTIAALNGCGRFSPIRFEMHGSVKDIDNWGCRAWAYDLDNGEKLEGPWVSIKMAKQEGWYGKNGSKWQTMPDLMLRYRAAKFFGNLYAPDLLMGMYTEDENRDIGDRNQSVSEKHQFKQQDFRPAKKPEQEQKQETKPEVKQEQDIEGF